MAPKGGAVQGLISMMITDNDSGCLLHQIRHQLKVNNRGQVVLDRPRLTRPSPKYGILAFFFSLQHRPQRIASIDWPPNVLNLLLFRKDSSARDTNDDVIICLPCSRPTQH